MQGPDKVPFWPVPRPCWDSALPPSSEASHHREHQSFPLPHPPSREYRELGREGTEPALAVREQLAAHARAAIREGLAPSALWDG